MAVLPWALVSPASRGIGFALAKRLLKTTELPVLATARTDTNSVHDRLLDGLDGIDGDRLTVLPMDVLDEKSMEGVVSHCQQKFDKSHLRLAFCIPGILHPEKSPMQIDAEDALQTFRVNAIGPLLMSKHFTSFLPRKSTILEEIIGLPNHAVFATMSARVGSISDNALGGWYSYRASKAAVNAIAKSVDIYLQQRCGDKAMAISMHPGTVKTGLSEAFWNTTPQEKLFTSDFAANRLIDVVNTVGLAGRGRCWDWRGKEIPP